MRPIIKLQVKIFLQPILFEYEFFNCYGINERISQTSETKLKLIETDKCIKILIFDKIGLYFSFDIEYNS
jgi:hypothetical protein